MELERDLGTRMEDHEASSELNEDEEAESKKAREEYQNGTR